MAESAVGSRVFSSSVILPPPRNPIPYTSHDAIIIPPINILPPTRPDTPPSRLLPPPSRPKQHQGTFCKGQADHVQGDRAGYKRTPYRAITAESVQASSWREGGCGEAWHAEAAARVSVRVQLRSERKFR